MTKTSVTLRLDNELLARLDATPGGSRTAKAMAIMERALIYNLGYEGIVQAMSHLETHGGTIKEAVVSQGLETEVMQAGVFNPPGFGKRYDAGPIKVGKAEAQVRDPGGLGKWPETGKR